MEKEKTLIESKCPYCGHENFHEFQDDNSNNTIMGRCSINLGGCGKSFAIRIPFDYMINEIKMNFSIKRYLIICLYNKSRSNNHLE